MLLCCISDVYIYIHIFCMYTIYRVLFIVSIVAYYSVILCIQLYVIVIVFSIVTSI
jgi:hypothetical protein